MELAANVLEEARAQPWDQLNQAWADGRTVPSEMSALLIDGKMIVKVEPDSSRTRRVNVEIRWKSEHDAAVQSVQMSTLLSARSEKNRRQAMKLHARRCGFTLIEILIVLVLLAVLWGVLTLILGQTLQLDAGNPKVSTVCSSAVSWPTSSADVAQAEKAPSEWEPYRADGHTLILQMKTGERLIYRWRDGRLQRLTCENRPFKAAAVPDDRVKAERTLPVGKQIAVEFVQDGKLVRLRLIALRNGKAVPGQTMEIAAALGGNWR